MPASVVAEDIEEEDLIIDIDSIQAHGNHWYILEVDQAHYILGVGAADISKLKTNGYYTVASVHAATRRALLKVKGLSEVKVEKIKEAIAKCQASYGRERNFVTRSKAILAEYQRLPDSHGAVSLPQASAQDING
ncbi:MAG: hypothetical protein GOMPHAMPRED_001871 [Gomphillus americanus]|uniref:Uncharacterized protein n=1 Tax=Gomphillus americanus TaxID=1940652 RepID=A0A8H3FA29_9LECA|nr:MAG: hypothetical protein GOMPHAMPRED_001871 [Gomphillus americanus]